MRLRELVYGAGTVSLWPVGRRADYVVSARSNPGGPNSLNAADFTMWAAEQERLFREHLTGQLTITVLCIAGVAGSLFLSTSRAPEWVMPLPYIVPMTALVFCNLYRAKRDMLPQFPSKIDE